MIRRRCETKPPPPPPARRPTGHEPRNLELEKITFVMQRLDPLQQVTSTRDNDMFERAAEKIRGIRGP